MEREDGGLVELLALGVLGYVGFKVVQAVAREYKKERVTTPVKIPMSKSQPKEVNDKEDLVQCGYDYCGEWLPRKDAFNDGPLYYHLYFCDKDCYQRHYDWNSD